MDYVVRRISRIAERSPWAIRDFSVTLCYTVTDPLRVLQHAILGVLNEQRVSYTGQRPVEGTATVLVLLLTSMQSGAISVVAPPTTR